MNKRQRAAKQRAAKAKEMIDGGYTREQAAEALGVSLSSIYRDLSETYCKRNRAACKKRKHAPLPAPPEKLCRVCLTRFQPQRTDQFICDLWVCKQAWQRLKNYYVELSPDLIREHIEYYGGEITEEICNYIGLTAEEVKRVIEDGNN